MYNDVVHGSITYLQCGRFTTSCQAWFSILGSNLSASCTNNAAVYQSVLVDLNPHISNDNRNLVQGAKYIATCTPRGFGLFGSLIFMYAYCAQDDHTLDYTSYNVNNNVVNDNGFWPGMTVNCLLASCWPGFCCTDHEWPAGRSCSIID
jgi:hypothetical protein